MASKAKEVAVNEKERDDAPPIGATETTDTLPPLLDLSDAAVKRLIRIVKKRGYVTHDQVKSLSEELNSEQIEDVLAMFSEMGVNVVEYEDATDDDEKDCEEADEERHVAGILDRSPESIFERLDVAHLIGHHLEYQVVRVHL